MIHDIWLLSGKEIQYQEKIDKFLCLSNWHKEFVSQHHNIPLDKIQREVKTIKNMNKPIITVCKSGARSGMAKSILKISVMK